MQTFFIAFCQRMNYSIFEPKFSVNVSSPNRFVLNPSYGLPKHKWKQYQICIFTKKVKSTATNYHMLVAVTQKYYESTTTIGYRSEHNHSSYVEFAWPSHFYILTRRITLTI